MNTEGLLTGGLCHQGAICTIKPCDRGRWKVARRPSLALFKIKTCLCWLQQQVSQQPYRYCSERAVRVPGRSRAGFCHFLFSLLHGGERGGHSLVKFAKGRNASPGLRKSLFGPTLLQALFYRRPQDIVVKRILKVNQKTASAYSQINIFFC